MSKLNYTKVPLAKYTELTALKYALLIHENIQAASVIDTDHLFPMEISSAGVGMLSVMETEVLSRNFSYFLTRDKFTSDLFMSADRVVVLFNVYHGANVVKGLLLSAARAKDIPRVVNREGIFT